MRSSGVAATEQTDSVAHNYSLTKRGNWSLFSLEKKVPYFFVDNLYFLEGIKKGGKKAAAKEVSCNYLTFIFTARESCKGGSLAQCSGVFFSLKSCCFGQFVTKSERALFESIAAFFEKKNGSLVLEPCVCVPLH